MEEYTRIFDNTVNCIKSTAWVWMEEIRVVSSREIISGIVPKHSRIFSGSGFYSSDLREDTQSVSGKIYRFTGILTCLGFENSTETF